MFFASLSAGAEQTLRQGILQAYWLPVWSNDGLKNTPELRFRYFIITDDEKTGRIINLNVDIKNAEPEQLQHDFSSLPSTFLTWKAGHIERAGEITVEELTASTECDYCYYSAEMTRFKPAGKTTINTNQLEQNAGCEAWPWMLAYTLKPGVKNRYFKQKPDAASNDLQPIN